MPKYLPPISAVDGRLLDHVGALLDAPRHPDETDRDYRRRLIDTQAHQLAIAANRRDELLREALEKAAPYRMRMEDFMLSPEEMERLQAPLRRCVITPISWKELSADEVCNDVRKDVAELRAKDLGIDADWLWSQPVPAAVTPLFVEQLRDALHHLDVVRRKFFELQHANYYADPAVRQYCANMVKSIDDAKNKMLYGGKNDGE